jgi:adenylosuccinate synthase
VSRRGIRVADLLDPPSLVEAIARLAEQKNFELTEYYKWQPVDVRRVTERALEWGRRLAPYVDHTERTLERALRAGKNVLFEGAQGNFLDVDHGTYPYVTSSNCVAGAVCAGAGVGPTRIDRVLGITKAYTTRVGGGPFPTELETRRASAARARRRVRRDDRPPAPLRLARRRDAARGGDGQRLHRAGREQARRAVGDRRDPDRDRVPIDGKVTEDFPMTLAEIERAEPIYETHEGWSEDLSGCRRFTELPAAAQRYVERVEALVGVPVELISIGPNRDETIVRSDPFGS